MKAVEIYNMKINMGLVDLQKYYDLVNQIKNIPNRYIEIFDLKKIADEIKEELKIEIKRDVDELIDLYSKLVLNLHLKLGNELSELEFKLNKIKGV